MGPNNAMAGGGTLPSCDGHVENLRPLDLFNLSNALVAQRWNIDHQPHNQSWVPPGPP